MIAEEANFDGLVGPTHNYSGLAYGNLASEANTGEVSNPRGAALQGLAKMKQLADWGYWQGVLPPQERPNIEALKKLGFSGSDRDVLAHAARYPELLAAASSASSMWAANAATVSPSSDTADHRVHFTPANLVSKYHRSLEPTTTGRILRATFPSREHFHHHRPLPPVAQFGDEGAANHTRFASAYQDSGVEMFVYGRMGFGGIGEGPQRYPARQTLEASEAVVRKHLLKGTRVVFAQQHPKAIDAGVFHNDVIAVGNRNLLFCHEHAFLNQRDVLRQLEQAFKPKRLEFLQVGEHEVSVEDAVKSYLFNSQLLGREDGKHWLVVPEECRQNKRVWAYLQGLQDGKSPISEVKVVDVTQSMRNGGGPACLRLRVVLNEPQRAVVNPGSWLTGSSYKALVAWVEKHYRDQLAPGDLADPLLLNESRTALDELTGILGLGSIYSFQQ